MPDVPSFLLGILCGFGMYAIFDTWVAEPLDGFIDRVLAAWRLGRR